MWIYIVIATIIVLVYIVNLNLKVEHLGVQPTLEKVKQAFLEPKLNEPITWTEYNRNDIPIPVRDKLVKLIMDNVLVKTDHRLAPVNLDYVRIQQDNEKSLWYVEIFIQDSRHFTSEKLIWQFWSLPGGQYRLKDLRPFSYEDRESVLVPKYYGVDKNLVITQDNITNPLEVNLEAGLNSKDPTDLELYPIDNTLKNDIVGREGRQPYARCYNKWVLPDTIWDKNAYVSFTPDIVQNMLYRTDTYDDLFSRTRFDPAFPHGRSTGGI